jgi:hypothetical protein
MVRSEIASENSNRILPSAKNSIADGWRPDSVTPKMALLTDAFVKRDAGISISPLRISESEASEKLEAFYYCLAQPNPSHFCFDRSMFNTATNMKVQCWFLDVVIS